MLLSFDINKAYREITLKSYATILDNLYVKVPHIDASLMNILKLRNTINLNVNISLLIDHLIYQLVKE